MSDHGKYLFGFICFVWYGILTIITKKLDWFMLGTIETGGTAVKSGIAAMAIGCVSGYAYFKKHWRAGLYLLKKGSLINFLLIITFIIDISLRYLADQMEKFPGWITLFSFAAWLIAMNVYDSKIESAEGQQNLS
jgi:hypothetical protein